MNNLSNKKNFNLLYSVILNGIIFTVLLMFGTASYEMIDDYVLSQHIANGFYSFTFSNLFLLKIFGFIQELLYPLNAYAIVSLILSFVSIVAVNFVFLEKLGLKGGTIASLFIHSIYATSYFLTISFTRFAATLAMSGLILIIHYSQQKKWVFGVIFGSVISLIGAMYRFRIFLSVFAIGVALIIAVSFNDFDISDIKKKLPILLKNIFEPKRIICLALVLGLSFSMNAFSKKIFRSDPEIKNYIKYSSARSKVWDYGIPSYEQAKSDYDAIGIDSNDLMMLENGLIDEQGGFSLEKLKQIEQVQKKYNNENETIINKAKIAIATEVFGILHLTIEGVSIIGLIFAALGFFLLQKKPKWIPPIIIVASLFVIYALLWYVGRVRYRLVFGPLFFSTFSFVYLIDKNNFADKLKKQKILKIIGTVGFSLIIVFNSYFSYSKMGRSTWFPATDAALNIVREIKSDTSSKYEFFAGKTVTWSGDVEIKDVFHVEKLNPNANYLDQTCVYYLSPFYNKTLRDFGTDNVYKNLFNENVYAVFLNEEDVYNCRNYLCKYLQKYYSNGKTVEMQLIRTVGDYSIYKYTLV